MSVSRQALLQAAALHGVVEDGLLALNRYVVDADIGLRAGAHGGDTAMFMLFLVSAMTG